MRNKNHTKLKIRKMSLTGVKDVDMEIILQLEDKELPRVCAVNRYVNEICQSDAFWYRRLINRITKVRDDNLSKYKNLILIDITGARIREMQRFYGLKSLKDLNIFLNELPANAAYIAYHGFSEIDDRIKETYNINENDLPKYINRDELRYEMRRELTKERYRPRNNRVIDYISYIVEIRPNGVKKVPIDIYDAFKSWA